MRPVATLRRSLTETRPGAFAAVMATAIVSTAVDRYHLHALAIALTAVAVGVYLWLVAGMVARLLLLPRGGFEREWSDARQSFGFLTFVAGSTVLGERLDELGAALPGLLLVGVGILSWFALGYAVGITIMVRSGKRPALAELDGGWMLWVVATQSLATAGAMVAVHEPQLRRLMAVVAAAGWAAGCVLYIVLISILMARLLLFDVAPEDIEPNYWVTMGATAISVLAGARILNLPPATPVVAAVAGTVGGVSFMLWAFGTWLVPILLALGIWRHVIHRTPLRYDAGFWTLVFPLGMYSSASAELGGAEHLPFMAVVGGVAAYVALAAWTAVALGWVVRPRDRPTGTRPSRAPAS